MAELEKCLEMDNKRYDLSSTLSAECIKVGGVLKTSWIDLLSPINLIIWFVNIYLDKFGQRWAFLEYFDF